MSNTKGVNDIKKIKLLTNRKHRSCQQLNTSLEESSKSTTGGADNQDLSEQSFLLLCIVW